MGSSDEFNNTSDESGNTDALIKQMNDFDVAGTETRQPTTHCSYQPEPRTREMGNTLKRHIPTPKERAEQLIKEAELAKEKLARIPGKGVVEDNMGKIDSVHDGHLLHSVIVDEEYMAIASHIDEGLRRRIILGEYIDLARLLLRDRIQGEEDQ